MKYNKIALIGMMGCGKSTIAKLLAIETKYNLFEADEIFEKENSIKIKDFFKQFGEKKFREIETKILKKISSCDNFILSCGGGVVLANENRDILFNSDIFTIYLKAEVNSIYERIKNDFNRPLLLVDNPKNEIEKILLEREKYYNLANLKINTDNKSVDDIKKEILDVLWKKL